MEYTYEYPRAMNTVDVVILNAQDDRNIKILLIKRGRDPYKDCWAFPGGFSNTIKTFNLRTCDSDFIMAEGKNGR